MKTAWIIFVGIILTSCGFTGDSGKRASDVLVMNNMAEPSFLDPGLQSGAEDQRISLALFEGLTVPHPKTLEPLPGVAEKWSISPDGLTYDFHLRLAHWSDGHPVSADDFLYAWRRVLTPPSADPARRFSNQKYYISAPYVDVLFAIRGAEDWHRGLMDRFDDVGISVLNDRHLRVVLERPTPWFLELLSFPTLQPVPQHAVEEFGRDWTRPEHFVSNGPFNLSERRQGDLLRVKRSENYWDRASVGLSQIDYLSTDQIDTAIDQFLAGESDWVRSFNPKKVRAWRKDPELSEYLRAPEFLATFFLRLNMREEVFAKKGVRKALAQAIDREAITKYVTGLGEVPARGLVPLCINIDVPWQGPGEEGLSFDPQAARKSLAESGFPQGLGLPTITIAFNTDTKNKAIAEAIQQMWTKELGLNVVLENREKKVHYARERAGQYMISRGNWIGDYSDPSTFLNVFRSTGSSNRCSWSNATYDALLDQARLTQDQKKRSALLHQAERILCVDDPAIIPIFHYKTAYLLRPKKFEGIFENSRNIHPPKFIRRRSS